jgi:predicted Zn-dependent protease
MEWIRTAIKSWDNALATVSFREANSEESPQITIGYVELKPAEVQLDAMGFWNTWVESGVRYRATIKLKSSEVRWFSSKNQFIQTVQHELGNVLGLGDLKPSIAIVSVLEDPWQPPYGKYNLSSTDVAMIRQLYGESTCTKKTSN